MHQCLFEVYKFVYYFYWNSPVNLTLFFVFIYFVVVQLSLLTAK